jgi:hypothetical protein
MHAHRKQAHSVHSAIRFCAVYKKKLNKGKGTITIRGDMIMMRLRQRPQESIVFRRILRALALRLLVHVLGQLPASTLVSYKPGSKSVQLQSTNHSEREVDCEDAELRAGDKFDDVEV